jgi:hypothetical protein
MFFKQASFHVVTHRVVVTKQAFQMCKCCPIANICLQRIVFLDPLSKSYVKNFASKCKYSRLRLDNLTRPTILTPRLCPTEHSVLRNTKTFLQAFVPNVLHNFLQKQTHIQPWQNSFCCAVAFQKIFLLCIANTFLCFVCVLVFYYFVVILLFCVYFCLY